MTPIILAVDQSTSATKAMLFSSSGALLNSTSIEHRQYYPQPGWVEHDADEIYHNTCRAIATLLDRHPQVGDELLFLSLTNQRETVVVFERGTGRPLHHAIVWQCNRAEGVCRELVEEGHDALVQNATGLKIDPYFPAPKLTWLFAHEPAIKEAVREGRALVGTIDAYLVYRLTRGEVFATDHTNASRTLLYNIARLGWDETLCDLFGIPLTALPEVRESCAAFGETDVDGLLPRPIPIYGVMGDSQAALFAERCFEPGMAKVTFGTGSSVLLNLGDVIRRSTNGIVTAVGWVLNGRPVYAFEGNINFTGATVAWLRDQVGLIASSAETEGMALAVPDNGGVYLVPAFVGLGAPYWRPDARGAIVGLTPATTRNHLARAALEAIAYQVCDVLRAMAQDAGVPLEVIHADGGAVRNRFLMQFVADITRYRLRASSLPELSALGAVMMGLLGAGVCRTLDDLARLPAEAVDYAPLMDEGQVSRYYAGWQAAVRRVLVE